MGTASQSKETVTFIIQNLHQALLDRLSQEAASDPHGLPPNMLSRAPSAGHLLGTLPEGASLGGSRTPTEGGAPRSANFSLSPSMRAREAAAVSRGGQPQQPGYQFILKTAGSGAVNVMGTALQRLLALAFSSRAGMLYLALICAIQLYVLFVLRASHRGAVSVAVGPPDLNRSFWVERLQLLQRELELLAGRTDAATREVAAVMQFLGQPASDACANASSGQCPGGP